MRFLVCSLLCMCTFFACTAGKKKSQKSSQRTKKQSTQNAALQDFKQHEKKLKEHVTVLHKKLDTCEQHMKQLPKERPVKHSQEKYQAQKLAHCSSELVTTTYLPLFAEKNKIRPCGIEPILQKYPQGWLYTLIPSLSEIREANNDKWAPEHVSREAKNVVTSAKTYLYHGYTIPRVAERLSRELREEMVQTHPNFYAQTNIAEKPLCNCTSADEKRRPHRKLPLHDLPYFGWLEGQAALHHILYGALDKDSITWAVYTIPLLTAYNRLCTHLHAIACPEKNVSPKKIEHYIKEARKLHNIYQKRATEIDAYAPEEELFQDPYGHSWRRFHFYNPIEEICTHRMVSRRTLHNLRAAINASTKLRIKLDAAYTISIMHYLNIDTEDIKTLYEAASALQAAQNVENRMYNVSQGIERVPR